MDTVKRVRVLWRCGYIFDMRPFCDEAECGNEFYTEVELKDWDDGKCTAVCPECGNVLYQTDADPELA